MLLTFLGCLGDALFGCAGSRHDDDGDAAGLQQDARAGEYAETQERSGLRSDNWGGDKHVMKNGEGAWLSFSKHSFS